MENGEWGSSAVTVLVSLGADLGVAAAGLALRTLAWVAGPGRCRHVPQRSPYDHPAVANGPFPVHLAYLGSRLEVAAAHGHRR